MDYYQGVVVDYLRCDRAMFVNEECLIQLHPGNMPPKNESWVCDAVAINLRKEKVFLCEVSQAVGMSNLIRRLKSWNDNWGDVKAALVRDSHIDPKWEVRPWLFVPSKFVEPLKIKMLRVLGPEETWKFKPDFKALESVQPWEPRLDLLNSVPDRSDTVIPEEVLR